MKLAWATDIHLDIADEAARGRFYDEIRASRADALLVTGDLAHGWTLEGALRDLVRAIERPIYFVLGNHDFYSHDALVPVVDIRAMVSGLCRADASLHYLVDAGVINCDSDVGLVGHDGWADGRAGSWWKSTMSLLDHELVGDLVDARDDRGELLRRVQLLADQSVAHLRRHLPLALRTHRRVLVATHAPPFRAAAWHNGKPSDDNAAPHFCNQILGEVIEEVAAANPRREILVLCGHTHSPGEVTVRPNLTVLTGAATYGHPALARVIDL